MECSASLTPRGIVKWPLHQHGYWEIMYYTEGEGALQSGQQTYAFVPHTMIVVPPGVQHGSASEHAFRNISIGADFQPFFPEGQVLVAADNADADGLSLASMIYKNQSSDPVFQKALLETYAVFVSRSAARNHQTHPAVDRIRAEIDDRFTDTEFNVTRLLRQSGYAEDYIRMQFKKETGMAPVAFLTERRMSHAVRLLEIYGGDISVERLAEMCGYIDPAYFSRCFKKAVGVSPRQYVHRHYTAPAL